MRAAPRIVEIRPYDKASEWYVARAHQALCASAEAWEISSARAGRWTDFDGMEIGVDEAFSSMLDLSLVPKGAAFVPDSDCVSILGDEWGYPPRIPGMGASRDLLRVLADGWNAEMGVRDIKEVDGSSRSGPSGCDGVANAPPPRKLILVTGVLPGDAEIAGAEQRFLAQGVAVSLWLGLWYPCELHPGAPGSCPSCRERRGAVTFYR